MPRWRVISGIQLRVGQCLNGVACGQLAPVLAIAPKRRARRMAAGAFFERGRYLSTPLWIVGNDLAIRSFFCGFDGTRAPQAVAGEIDAVRVVNDAIHDRVGISGIGNYVVPFVHGDLAGDDC